MMKTSIIFLTGFMASGKSTIGPILANTIGWGFYDLDKEIEKRKGKKIKEIFDEKGEAAFRATEREVLMEISSGINLIISLGGGTMADQKNITLMKKKGKIIYLHATAESFYYRLKYKTNRPTLIGKNKEILPDKDLRNRIEELLNYRKKFYDQADYTIKTDGISIGQTVDSLAKIILKEL
ncbi:MAG TPA: shikimate kinase [Ignavibacteriaceae bacterium]|nr:shikimate kinase [Ignavibacteriaceae bacterium]